MKIAVIGANGYVGRNLLRYLRGQGLKPIAVFKPMFDLLVPKTWNVLDQDIECIVHAAGLSQGYDAELTTLNAKSASDLGLFCSTVGIRKIVYLSTGRVYGPTDGPTHVNMTCCPTSTYGTSKLAGERGISANFRGETAVVRLYYPYGRDQDPKRFIPRIRAAIRARQPVVGGVDGGPRLSVSHIDDVCERLVRDFIFGNPPPLTNLASDKIISIRAVAEMIAAAERLPLRYSRTTLI